jgi:hypothetical protein
MFFLLKYFKGNIDSAQIVTNSEDLITWITILAMKCSIIKENSFVVIISSLMFLNYVRIIPLWKKLLKLIWTTVSAVLWAILILIILSSFGRYLAFGSTLDAHAANNTLRPTTSKSGALPQSKQLSLDFDAALQSARKEALKTASDELDVWISSLMYRVDNPDEDTDFLDWYFGYWTQQKFGLEGIVQQAKRIFNPNTLTAKDKIQEEVLQEFTVRVLRPEIAKLELKKISRDVSQVYTNELQQNFDKVRIKYDIPKADWEQYLQNVTVTITDIQGKQTSLELKAFTIASLGGTALLAKTAIIGIEKVTAKVATKALAKAGTSFLGKAASIEFGPFVIVAIALWDAIDIHNTEVQYRPILKRNIEDHFNSIKTDILDDDEHGIQKLVLDIENSIRRGIDGSRFPFFN